MKSPKNLVLGLLLLTTIGGATVAWRQYQELIELRAAALNQDERADLQKRLWDAEKRAKELADQLAARRGTAVAEAEGGDGEENSPATTNNRRGRRGPGGAGGPGGLNNLMSVMERPEVQKLVAIQQKGQLDSRYAALFKNLNLSPEQLDKFKTLLVEKQTAMQDVMAAARAQGIDPREDPEGFRKMIRDTQAEVDTNIKEVLGDASFAQYQNYQQTAPQRNVVNQLQQSLSYTNAPLSDAQAEQLVQILAQTNPKNSQNGNRTETVDLGGMGMMGGPVSVAFTTAENPGQGGGGRGNDRFTTFAVGGGGLGGGNSAPITNEAINLAQGVLSAPQVQGLQQLQEQQQAQQQLQQTLRQSFGGGARGTNATGGTSGGSAPSAVPATGKKG